MEVRGIGFGGSGSDFFEIFAYFGTRGLEAGLILSRYEVAGKRRGLCFGQGHCCSVAKPSITGSFQNQRCIFFELVCIAFEITADMKLLGKDPGYVLGRGIVVPWRSQVLQEAFRTRAVFFSLTLTSDF